jgi:hypothetical protein
MTRFESRLKDLSDEQLRRALIEVCDTAYLCTLWLEQYAVEGGKPTAADVLELTKLVLQRERDIIRMWET